MSKKPFSQESLYNIEEATVVTSRPSSTAQLLLSSSDRAFFTGKFIAPLSYYVTQPYNNFRLQKGENLLQGGFTRISVTEVLFPYNIPNVNTYTNTFWVSSPVLPTTVPVTISIGYYDGAGLAAAVKAELDIVAAPIGPWTCTYNPNNQGFTISTPTTAEPFALYPNDPAIASKDETSLLTVMGWDFLTNSDYLTNVGPSPLRFVNVVQSVGASMSYTKYIDIVSDKLTYYANVKDGDTNRPAPQSNCICRLYIADENSTVPSVGAYWNGTAAVTYKQTQQAGITPFLINRKFPVPKCIDWDKNTAVDWIDIKLYDDSGRPLYYNLLTEQSGNFNITLLASED
jgi:hypothetical protein